ncbi:uncharacterized protein LOC113548043 [Rhopalosiphum maidis]|uniref:uncharacterized protein LOC113548043 n=1 Tax=Rhopalosiphum maidis TaxID=43146 RepID=UPI000EFF8210|nr:uncharacterized protein LOC113548043 [Rhopalosiphum maidis]
MHRKIAVFVLLQCMAIFACHLKSDIPRSQRSIIGVPTFLSDRFAQEQRRTVIGYDGQCRQMFEDRERYSSSCSSQPKAQLAAQPEKQQYVRNDDAWWLAVIDNANRNNEQLLQREIETKEVCTKFQWTSQYNQ